MRFRDDLMESWITDKKTFQYSDGSQDLHADPMEVLQNMNAFAGGDLGTVRDAAYPEPVPDTEIKDGVEVPKVRMVPKMKTVPKLADGKPIVGADGQPVTEEVQEKHPDGQPVVDEVPVFVHPPVDAADTAKFYDMIRAGFDIPPRDRTKPGGFTRPMLDDLWNRFMAWMFDIKKKPSSSQTSSAPTEEESLPV